MGKKYRNSGYVHDTDEAESNAQQAELDADIHCALYWTERGVLHARVKSARAAWPSHKGQVNELEQLRTALSWALMHKAVTFEIITTIEQAKKQALEVLK